MDLHTRAAPASLVVRVACAALAALAAPAALAGCAGWSPTEFAPPPRARPPVDPSRDVSVATLNAWRLREPARVPLALAALARVGEDLAITVGDDPLPDVVALQELEGDAPVDALARGLAPTHWFASCVCARNGDGTQRSTVALAVRRARFAVASHRCVELGALWPDHPRCALVARARPVDGDEAQLDLVSVHLSARPANAPQAARLRDELRAAGALDAPRVVVAGDFNFAPGADGYRTLTRAGLRDPFGPERERTHWFAGRIDFVFVGPRMALVRPLDRWASREAVAPADSLEPTDACRRGAAPSCPVSDHLPEGAVFRYR